jgi:hypothetical protein
MALGLYMLGNLGYKHTHTHTHAEYVILTAFPRNNGYTKTPQYWVIRAFPSCFIWYLYFIIIIIIIIISQVLVLDRPVSSSFTCLFKGLPRRLRSFGLYYQTILHIWYYERLLQIWDLNLQWQLICSFEVLCCYFINEIHTCSVCSIMSSAMYSV